MERAEGTYPVLVRPKDVLPGLDQAKRDGLRQPASRAVRQRIQVQVHLHDRPGVALLVPVPQLARRARVRVQVRRRRSPLQHDPRVARVQDRREREVAEVVGARTNRAAPHEERVKPVQDPDAREVSDGKILRQPAARERRFPDERRALEDEQLRVRLDGPRVFHVPVAELASDVQLLSVNYRRPQGQSRAPLRAPLRRNPRAGSVVCTSS
eukprot:952382-Rhodomonas_salina.1